MTTHQLTEESHAEEHGMEHVRVETPYGLLGFETIKDYYLISDPEEKPFMWFQMKGDESEAKSFLVISPFVIHEGYSPEFSDEEMESIGIESVEDVLLINIVTIHSKGSASVNLKGPIVINKRLLKGKQIVPINAMDYRVDHPLTTDSNII